MKYLVTAVRGHFTFYSTALRYSVSCGSRVSTQRTPFKPARRHFSVVATLNMPEKKPFERLPTDVVPKNYNLSLQPDLKAFTFTGSQNITLDVQKATKQVKLNCVDIDIKSASFSANGKDITNPGINYNKDEETATVSFPSDLPMGTGQLRMDFVGELNDKMKGFYRSKYKGSDGEERYCAVTQFESTDARRAFPCWDEPAIKATFEVTLVVPKDLVALSNMNVVENKPLAKNESLQEVKYAVTPVMSTYLLAFVVGEFDYVESKSQDGVLVRVYTPVGKKEQGQFALEVATKTLPFYKDYFDIAYPLPKMDLIAIPDFAAGAMENWGLVTYRETALLIDPQNSSAATKQWVALVVGHELAHQWFGNLVTMEWWTHLWLNEGFASWIEYLCVDYCFSEYDIWTQFITNDYTRALNLDALKNSHPIEVPVGHPSEVDEIFDLISYSKGASVIRMLHDYLGDDAFKKGMSQYLKKHKYGNAATEDLWASLGQASGKPVERVMSTWTKQMGFPVLTVTANFGGGDQCQLNFAQSKFCADGPIEGESPQWLVPVSVSTSKDPTSKQLTTVIEQPTATVTVSGLEANSWIKVNPGHKGFYRTKYSSDLLERLIPAIADRTLPPIDRLGLESDLFALAKAGQASTVEYLRLLEGYRQETNYTVWNDVMTNLAVVAGLLLHTDYGDLLKTLGRDLLANMSASIGWDPKENEGHLDALLRSLVVGSMGRFGHQESIEEARRRLEAHVSGSTTLPADLRAAVYSTCLKHGDEETFEKMLALYRKEDMQEERDRIARSLGSVRDAGLIKRVLDFSISEEVRSQDTVFVLAGVTGSLAGREMAWQFLQDNWQMLYGRYDGGFLLARLVKVTTEGFASEERAQEVEKFFKSNSAPAAERTIQQSLENIRLNVAWLAKDSANIKHYLENRA